MESAKQPKYFTIDDIYNLPEGKRAELIDGELYMMATPSTKHQIMVTELTYQNKLLQAVLAIGQMMKATIVQIMILILNIADKVMQQKHAMHLFIIYLSHWVFAQFMAIVMCGMYHHGNFQKDWDFNVYVNLIINPIKMIKMAIQFSLAHFYMN